MRKLILSSLFLLTSFAFAGQEIGMAPEAVYQIKITEEEPMLFIDVRDPVEIMFVGGTDMVDLNIPYMLVDRNSWNEERGTFDLYLNPNFADEVTKALEERNLPKDTMIVTMCRSGSERGKPSADALREAGFSNAHYVVNGFQGDAIKTGDNKGFRTQNGWQNSSLPWTPTVDGDKIYKGLENKTNSEVTTTTDKVDEKATANNVNKEKVALDSDNAKAVDTDKADNKATTTTDKVDEKAKANDVNKKKVASDSDNTKSVDTDKADNKATTTTDKVDEKVEASDNKKLPATVDGDNNSIN